MTITALVAQSIPPVPAHVAADAFKEILTVVGWMAAVVMGCIAFFRKPKTEISNQPLEVRGSVEFIARREFEEQRTDTRRGLDLLRAEMDKRFESLALERRASLENLHRHITATGERQTTAISELRESIEERLEAGNNRMNQLDRGVAALEAISNKGGKR